MKMTTISIALAALLMNTAAYATDPSASGSGSVSVGTQVSGGFSLGNNGTSVSYATNSEAARATVTASTATTLLHSNVTAGVKGDTQTESFGKAYNISTGSGVGGAISSGSANTGVQGQAGIAGVTSGFNGGNAGTQTSNVIVAGTNQGSYVQGQTASGFDVDVSYQKASSYAPAPYGFWGGSTTKAVEVDGSATGYASGNNTTSSLVGMNAAGIANIQASGFFFGKTGLSASTGTVTAP